MFERLRIDEEITLLLQPFNVLAKATANLLMGSPNNMSSNGMFLQ